MKIIGDIRENSKITVTGIVTGGSEGSSRVQWFKTRSSILESLDGFEALSTSKIAKVSSKLDPAVSCILGNFQTLEYFYWPFLPLSLMSAQAFRIPLGAVGFYIVAKFTPMTPDGESGEPAYAISDRPVDSKPFLLVFCL